MPSGYQAPMVIGQGHENPLPFPVAGFSVSVRGRYSDLNTAPNVLRWTCPLSAFAYLAGTAATRTDLH